MDKLPIFVDLLLILTSDEVWMNANFRALQILLIPYNV